MIGFPEAGDINLESFDSSTGAEKTVRKLNGITSHLAWMPDGNGLLATVVGRDTGWFSQIVYVPYPDGPIRRVTNDLNNYRQNALSITADGKSLVAVQVTFTSDLAYVPVDRVSTDADPLPSAGERAPSPVAVLPDGKLLLRNILDLITRKEDGSERNVIFNDGWPLNYPQVCQNGKYVVFSEWRNVRSTIMRVEISGANATELTPTQAGGNAPTCSPDGQWVYYIAYDNLGGQNELKRLPLNGGAAQTVSLSIPGAVLMGGSDMAFSPDGKLLLIGGLRGNTTQDYRQLLLIYSLADGKLVKEFPRDGRINGLVKFMPDGKSLILPLAEGGTVNLYKMSIDDGKLSPITAFKTRGVNNQYTFTPDGKRILVSRGQDSSDVVMLTDAGK
jgi:Tol biopolymer transport system component